jgi:hypothetical protein
VTRLAEVGFFFPGGADQEIFQMKKRTKIMNKATKLDAMIAKWIRSVLSSSAI